MGLTTASAAAALTGIAILAAVTSSYSSSKGRLAPLADSTVRGFSASSTA